MKTIASSLEVSSRTVLRELEYIKHWVNQFSCELEKKSGKGIKLVGNENLLKQNIEQCVEEKIYTKQERRIILISELLRLEEPVKIFYLTKKLNVTESTVCSDLDVIAKWFEECNLKLVRQQGIGVYVTGEENYIRKSIMKLIYENLDYENMLNLITNEEDVIEKIVQERALGIIDRDMIRKLKKSMDSFRKELFIDIPDNLYISMLIHIAIVIERSKTNDKFKIKNIELDEVKNYKEYKIAEKIIQRIKEDFNIEIPKIEVGYIAMRLIGIKNYDENSEGTQIIEGITKEVLSIIEAETGKFLDFNVAKDLMIHLSVAIKRIKLGMEIRNPLLDEIKNQYKDLYDISRKCSMVIEKTMNLKVPEDEVGFIAMHIGAVLERSNGRAKDKYRVVIVCPTGIADSIILASQIKKSFDFIEIVDKISVINLNKFDLEKLGIDFIISTVKIKPMNISTVTVSSLLKEKDKEKILDCIYEIKNNKSRKFKGFKDEEEDFKAKIKSMARYSTGIVNILDNFFIEDVDVKNVDELINIIPSSMENSSISKRKIIKSLKEREEKGSTIIEDSNLMILHCRVDEISELHFGVCRFKEKIFIENDTYDCWVNGALVMIGPRNMSKEHREIMSNITEHSVENEEIGRRFLNEDKGSVYKLLGNIMNEFYESKK